MSPGKTSPRKTMATMIATAGRSVAKIKKPSSGRLWKHMVPDVSRDLWILYRDPRDGNFTPSTLCPQEDAGTAVVFIYLEMPDMQ